MIIVAIILLIAVLVYKLVHDYRFWLRERSVNHRTGWITTVLLCSPSIILFTLSSEFYWYIALPLSAGMCAFFIWLTFDSIYNKLRGFGIWFTGSDDKDDAITDNFLQAMPLFIHIILKTVPLSILIYIYIKGL